MRLNRKRVFSWSLLLPRFKGLPPLVVRPLQSHAVGRCGTRSLFHQLKVVLILGGSR